MADYLFDGEETIATLVCGVDEAGRGPLAGPVVAAAVILNPDHPIEGLRDSKKLTAHAREVLAEFYENNSKVFPTDEIRDSFRNFYYINSWEDQENPADWVYSIGEI